MSKQQMKKALVAKIVALGICSTPVLAQAYVNQLKMEQFTNLVPQLLCSKIEKATGVATITVPGGGGGLRYA